jgi:hypothetical protein
MTPAAIEPDPVAVRWRFLPAPETGERLVVTGLVTLIMCAAGVITVALRRRRW